jgi:hypothetical protein
MLDIVRTRLRETITEGDPPDVVDAKVTEAAPAVSEERYAALWLYAWHYAGGDGTCRPGDPVRHDGDRSPRPPRRAGP